MIRLIQRRLIIPRGDTGSFSIPVLKNSTDNIAVFTIFNEQLIQKYFKNQLIVRAIYIISPSLIMKQLI